MSNKNELYKDLVNSRLLKNNGGWIYCSTCNSPVGYLCYSTYAYYKFAFNCNCGERGSVEIGDRGAFKEEAAAALSIKKGRQCCIGDASPLFSIVGKNIKGCSFEVVCGKCGGSYIGVL